VNSTLTGLTKAYLLGSASRALSPREFGDLQPVEGGVLWLHLDYSDPEMARWVREESGVDAVVAEMLLAPETRPRSQAQGDGLLGINVGGIPGTGNKHAFLIVVGLLVVISAAQWIYFRWRKWF
jgi:Mg2+ and Co2+ transporter CorA